MPCFQLRSAGYGLLTIGVVNLLLTGSLTPQLLGTAPGRLTMANGLIAFAPWLLLSLALIFVQGNRQRLSQEPLPMLLLHRLLLPIAIGYLLLVPLMVRDALGVNRSVQGQIGQELRRFRTASDRLMAEVQPLDTPLAVARTLERYPNIGVTLAPRDTVAQVKARLAEALTNGQARLENRLDEVRRSRLEGLFQRTLAAGLVAAITATGLLALRRHNQEAIQQSGSEANLYFTRDLRRQGVRSSSRSPRSGAVPEGPQSSG